jgi:DNA repair protein RadC
VVLGRGNTKENAVDISNRILRFFNLDKLAILSFHELNKEFKNPVPAMKVLAMFDLFRRTNRLKDKEYKVKNKEHFYALFLDTKNRIIGEELISVGTLNASLIHPREVFNTAIKASANSVILVHNHPSGDCEPSSDDKQVTKMLNNESDIIGINVLDYVIIGKDKYVILKEKKIL